MFLGICTLLEFMITFFFFLLLLPTFVHKCLHFLLLALDTHAAFVLEIVSKLQILSKVTDFLLQLLLEVERLCSKI